MNSGSLALGSPGLDRQRSLVTFFFFKFCFGGFCFVLVLGLELMSSSMPGKVSATELTPVLGVITVSLSNEATRAHVVICLLWWSVSQPSFQRAGGNEYTSLLSAEHWKDTE